MIMSEKTQMLSRFVYSHWQESLNLSIKPLSPRAKQYRVSSEPCHLVLHEHENPGLASVVKMKKGNVPEEYGDGLPS